MFGYFLPFWRCLCTHLTLRASRSSTTSPSAPHLQPTQPALPGGTRANPTANTAGNSGRHTAPHNTCTGSRAARGLTPASPSPVCCEKWDPHDGFPQPWAKLSPAWGLCRHAARCAQHVEQCPTATASGKATAISVLRKPRARWPGCSALTGLKRQHQPVSVPAYLVQVPQQLSAGQMDLLLPLFHRNQQVGPSSFPLPLFPDRRMSPCLPPLSPPGLQHR